MMKNRPIFTQAVSGYISDVAILLDKVLFKEFPGITETPILFHSQH